jgi:hypothetical protein
VLFISACTAAPTTQPMPIATTIYSGTYSTEENGDPPSCLLKVAQQAADQISFELSCVGSAPSYNTGYAADTIPLVENMAAYSVTYAGPCEIRLEFSAGQVIVSQSGSDADCGFGLGISSAGIYLQRDSAVPTFNCLKPELACTPTPVP